MLFLALKLLEDGITGIANRVKIGEYGAGIFALRRSRLARYCISPRFLEWVWFHAGMSAPLTAQTPAPIFHLIGNVASNSSCAGRSIGHGWGMEHESATDVVPRKLFVEAMAIIESQRALIKDMNEQIETITRLHRELTEAVNKFCKS